MKLIFDARYIEVNKIDGLTIYCSQAAKAMAAEFQTDEIVFLIKNNKQKSFLPNNDFGANTAKISFALVNNPTDIKEIFLYKKVLKYKPDIIFCPMQTFSFGFKFGLRQYFKNNNKVPRLILTIHDLIYYKYKTPPGFLPLHAKIFWRLYHFTFIPQRYLLNKADAVVAISKTTKSELIKNKLCKKPIWLIENAPRELISLTAGTRSADQDKKRVKERVFRHVSADSGVCGTQDAPARKEIDSTKSINLIYIGSFMPYKGVITLIKTQNILEAQNLNTVLHLCSKIDNKTRTRLLKHAKTPKNIIFHNGISDAGYSNLLKNNAIFVSASLAEGYGLPLSEALIAKTPCVITDIEIFREVAGDAALFSNPGDPQSFAENIEKIILKTPDYYKLLKTLNIKTFNSWELSAAKLKSYISEIL